MIPKNSVKPLELVVSAIHCLREKNGSSPQKIVRYLEGKYNVDTEVLKPHVQIGLKRGLSFGLITQKSGLYRLNDVLSSPKGSSNSDLSSVSSKRKFAKLSKGLKKQQLKRMTNRKRVKNRKPTSTQKQEKVDKRRRRRRRKKGFGGSGKSKSYSDGRRHRRKQIVSSGNKASKSDKRRKPKVAYNPVKSELSEGQNASVSNKEPERHIT